MLMKTSSSTGFIGVSGIFSVFLNPILIKTTSRYFFILISFFLVTHAFATARKIPPEVNAIQFQVSGTVTSDEGMPLSGVNIVEKGTDNGTETDFDGNYSLTVSSEEAVLVFSFVGMKTLEKPVESNSILDAVLEQDDQAL